MVSCDITVAHKEVVILKAKIFVFSHYGEQSKEVEKKINAFLADAETVVVTQTSIPKSGGDYASTVITVIRD